MTDERNEIQMPETAPDRKTLVLGLGEEGLRVTALLHAMPAASALTLACIDTDDEAVRRSPLSLKLAVSSGWALKPGSGCGGDITRGERAFVMERENIRKLLTGYDLLIVTCGLGGGTATGGVRTVASLSRSLNLPAVFVLTMPFAIESYGRRKNAEECLKELLQMTDIVLSMPNDLLYSHIPPDTPRIHAFAAAVNELARTVVGVSAVLRSREQAGADFASFMNLLRGRRATCGVGVGIASEGDGLDRCTLALERMMDSPFLGGPDAIRQADAAIVTLTGGVDLTLGETKRAVEHAAGLFPCGVNLITGVACSPALCGTVQMTLVSIRYDRSQRQPGGKSVKKWAAEVQEEEPHLLPDAANTENGMVQGVLDFMSYSRGIFEKYPKTKYKDEDLDIPTFQRRKITIDQGD